MFSPIISQIAIISQNRVLANTQLGTKNGIPWRFKTDLKRFQTLTSRHPIIMGRATFEAMRKPLPNRTNIIVTRDKNFKAAGCVITHSIEEAINWAKETEKEEIFIVGGGQIYEQSLSFTDRLYLTIVDETVDGDIFFPDFSDFRTILSEEEQTENGVNFKFIDLER
jgi:dihydrofolate reductase